MPDIFLADRAASSAIDRCHSLRSLLPPLAALPSLPLGMTEFWNVFAFIVGRGLAPAAQPKAVSFFAALRMTKFGML